MKKKMMIVTALLMAALTLNNNQASAQNANSKSNGTLEIIALFVPEFIAVRTTGEMEFKRFDVYLVSGTKEYKALRTVSRMVPSETNNNDNKPAVKKHEYRLMNFDMTDMEALTLKFQKIKFVADGKEMYYNLTKSEWEPNTN